MAALGTFEYLEQHHREEKVQLGRLAYRTDGKVGVSDVVSHRLHLRVLGVLGRVVDRDAVRRHADLAVEEGLVVVGVEPRERPRDEGLVELLAVVERGFRLRARDDDIALRIHHPPTVGPHQPMAPDVAVTRRVAERESRRQAVRLVRLRELEEAGEVLRELLESGLLHRADAVDDGVAGAAHRNGDPLALLGAVLLAHVVPAAVLAAEVVGDVGHVDELVRVLVRILEGRDDDVRAAADVCRHRCLGPHVLPALLVHAHLDARLLGELLGVRHPHVLVALDEALPPKHAQLRALLRGPVRLRGCVLRKQGASNAHRTGRGRAGDAFQELASREFRHFSSLVWGQTPILA